MTWNNKEVYPDTVQGVIAQVHQIDGDTPLPPTVRAHVQATIEALVPAMPFANALSLQAAELAACLAVFFDLEEAQAWALLATIEAAPSSPWTPSGLPGVHLLQLTGGPRVAGTTCLLVYGQSGYGLPRHRHLGDEWTLVLHGRVEEDNGHHWGPGDLLHRTTGSLHAVYAVGPTPCVCAIIDYGGFEIVAAPKG